MSEHIYLLSIGLFFSTILIIFGMRYGSAVLRERARLANDDAYRRLAEQAAGAEAQTAAALADIRAALDDLGPRVGRIEKTLNDVG